MKFRLPTLPIFSLLFPTRHLFRMRTILLLISLILGIPAAAWCVDPIRISNWSVLGPFLAAPRDN